MVISLEKAKSSTPKYKATKNTSTRRPTEAPMVWLREGNTVFLSSILASRQNSLHFSKSNTQLSSANKDGRPGRTRTPNIRIWSPALYQLELLACAMPKPSSALYPTYLPSLCKVCLLHHLQYFFNSNREVVFLRFLVVL